MALFFEVVVIRYLGTEVRVFAYLQNLTLIASFLGIGLGMILGHPPRLLRRTFPLIAGALFLLIAYAPVLNLTHLPFPKNDYFVWGTSGQGIAPLSEGLRYLGATLAFLVLVVAFFVALGGLVGEYLAGLPPLSGYGLNLAGSLAGILAFTALSFLALPPVAWVLTGLVAAQPFFWRSRRTVIAFAIIVTALLAVPQANTYWSPYYRVYLFEVPPPQGWPRPAAYMLTVNHDYHQQMVDLSPGFLAGHPEVEPNRSVYLNYQLPYHLVPRPQEVLIVGAGTGNDVAAALRNGAGHVDAVEIDPVILSLGHQLHPEHPYDSPRVTPHLNDARAFFKNTQKKYDLIIFGYLDAHTLLTSYSSLRLDNYVYTLESFQEARRLLKENGTLVLGFASGDSFVTDRLFATLTRAFGVAPEVFRYDMVHIIFVQGAGRHTARSDASGVLRITDLLARRSQSQIVATDHWPFLYLRDRSIPVAIWIILVPFLLGAVLLLRYALNLSNLARRHYIHLFLLGAGFLLLETRGVTELSLLFGSTWVVNALVISSFLAMGLLANAAIMVRPLPRRIPYAFLFALIGVGILFPYGILDTLSPLAKILAAGVLVASPVFFSGLIFSQSFRDVARPSEALGVNLMGAVVGGALENTVMIGGTAFLGALAAFLYVLSAVFVLRIGR